MDPEIKALVQNEELLTPIQKKVIAHIEEREVRVKTFIQVEIDRAIHYINHHLSKQPLRISKYPPIYCHQYQEIKDYISANTDKYVQESINTTKKIAEESFDECMGRRILDGSIDDCTPTQEELFSCGFRYEVDRGTVFYAVMTSTLNNLPKTTKDKRKRVINLVRATLLIEMALNGAKVVVWNRQGGSTSLDYFETSSHKLSPYDRDLWNLFSIMECCLYSPKDGSEKLIEYARGLALKNQELNQQLARINADIQAKEQIRVEGSRKGGHNKRLNENSRQIIRATEYLESIGWIKPLNEATEYNIWRTDNGLKTLSPNTARDHLDRARQIHKAKTSSE